MVMHRRVSVVAVLACLGSIAAPRAQTPDSYAAMRFRYIGPVGNRLRRSVRHRRCTLYVSEPAPNEFDLKTVAFIHRFNQIPALELRQCLI